MDANAALSQLSYEPKSTFFTQEKLQNLDFFKNLIFGKSSTNQSGKRSRKTRLDVSRYGYDRSALQLSYRPKLLILMLRLMRLPVYVLRKRSDRPLSPFRLMPSLPDSRNYYTIFSGIVKC